MLNLPKQMEQTVALWQRYWMTILNENVRLIQGLHKEVEHQTKNFPENLTQTLSQYGQSKTKAGEVSDSRASNQLVQTPSKAAKKK